jgi:hypothetical protein
VMYARCQIHIAVMENREYMLPNPSNGAEIDSGR